VRIDARNFELSWVIMVTDPQTQLQTHTHTGPITIHCDAAIKQCNSQDTWSAAYGISHDIQWMSVSYGDI